MQAPSENGQGLGGELKRDTKSVATSAIDRLHREVDSRKGGGVSQIHEVSSALQKTADELGAGSPEWLKSAFQKGADQISTFASSLEQKDSRQLVDEIGTFAKQSPGTFVAACAAAGFAAARLFKVGTTSAASLQSGNTENDRANPAYEVGSDSFSGMPGGTLQGSAP